MADAASIRKELFGGVPGPAAPPPPDETGGAKPVMPAAINAVLQGASFGFSDEATAYLRSQLPGGVPYEQGVAAERGQLDKFREDNPTAAFGLEAAGAIPTMLIPMGWAGRAIQVARGAVGLARGAEAGATATNLGRVAITGVKGAAQGATAGFGAGEGSPLDRLTGAALGGVLGAGGGAGLSALAQVSPRLAGELARMVRQPPPADEARQLIQRALEADGVTPERVLEMMNQSPRAGIETAADMAGENTRGLARNAVSVPGAGRAEGTTFLEGRQGGAGQRIRNDAAQLIGAQGDYFNTVDSIATRQRAAANDLYAKAYAAEPIPIEEIADLAKDSAFRRAYVKGMEILDREARSGGQPLPSGLVKSDKVLPVYAIDAIKRGLDVQIEAANRAGKRTEVRSLAQFKDALLSRVDTLVPEYAAAREAFAGDAALLDAAELGRSIMTTRPAEMQREIMNLSQSEMDAFRLGVMDSLGRALDKGKDGANQVRRIFATPEQRAQLRLAFPTPESFQQFQNIMEREAAFAETHAASLRVSQTASLLEGQKQLTPGVTPDMSNMLGRVVGALRSSDTNTRQQVAREVVQALLRPNPNLGQMVRPPVVNPRLSGPALTAAGAAARSNIPAAGLTAGEVAQ